MFSDIKNQAVIIAPILFQVLFVLFLASSNNCWNDFFSFDSLHNEFSASVSFLPPPYWRSSKTSIYPVCTHVSYYGTNSFYHILPRHKKIPYEVYHLVSVHKNFPTTLQTDLRISLFHTDLFLYQFLHIHFCRMTENLKKAEHQYLSFEFVLHQVLPYALLPD